jgi:hypothetical protein
MPQSCQIEPRISLFLILNVSQPYTLPHRHFCDYLEQRAVWTTPKSLSSSTFCGHLREIMVLGRLLTFVQAFAVLDRSNSD